MSLSCVPLRRVRNTHRAGNMQQLPIFGIDSEVVGQAFELGIDG